MIRFLKILRLALGRYNNDKRLTWGEAWASAEAFLNEGECAYIEACKRNEFW